MNLKIQNKTSFVNNFLIPLSKLTENSVIKVRKNQFSALSSSNDGTLIINCVYDQENDVDDTLYLNVPDINRLVKVLNCIETESVELAFNNNNIEYKSKTVGFKYHLLEDGIIDPPTVDINKIKNIDFDVRFNVQPDTINQLIRASTFTTETDKIYISTANETVNATLTDRQRHNVDSFTQEISTKYTGPDLKKELAINFETIRIISSIRFENLRFNINQDLNVFLFLIESQQASITVVSSGYVG